MSIFIDRTQVATKVSTSASTGPRAELRVGKSYDSSALLVGAVDELFFTDVRAGRVVSSFADWKTKKIQNTKLPPGSNSRR